MPTHRNSMDMTTLDSTPAVLDALQHQVAVFARRAEQTRLGGVGQARNSMDRAAYLLLNRLDQEGPMGVKALAAGMGIDSSTVTRQVAPLVDTGSGQAHLAPRGRPRRGAPAVAARPGAAGGGAFLAARADGSW